MNEQGIHVLVADDHPMVITGLEKLLTEQFGSVMMHTAKNGKQAIEIIEIEKIDLVITDWDMPEIGG